MALQVRRPRYIDGFDFSDDRVAVVIEADDDPSRWLLWHLQPEDTDPNGWVRRDWLQGVEQGFEFGDETAIEGFNWFPADSVS